MWDPLFVPLLEQMALAAFGFCLTNCQHTQRTQKGVHNTVTPSQQSQAPGGERSRPRLGAGGGEVNIGVVPSHPWSSWEERRKEGKIVSGNRVLSMQEMFYDDILWSVWGEIEGREGSLSSYCHTVWMHHRYDVIQYRCKTSHTLVMHTAILKTYRLCIIQEMLLKFKLQWCFKVRIKWK